MARRPCSAFSTPTRCRAMPRSRRPTDMTLQANDPSTGETVLREARMSWWALWPRVVLGLVGLVLAGWGLLRQDQAGYAAAAFGGLMFLWFVGSALLRRGAMNVKLTPRYIVLQTGLVSRHTSTVMLNR